MYVNIQLKKYWENDFDALTIEKQNLKEVSIKSVNSDNYNQYAIYTAYTFLNSHLFYDDGIIVTAINSEPIFIDDNILLLIKKILSYVNNESELLLKEQQAIGFLIEFLVLYMFSIRQEPYRNKEDSSHIKELMDSNFSRVFISDRIVYLKKFYRSIVIDDELNLNVIMPSFMTRIEKVNRLYEFSHDFLSELFVIVAKQHKYMFDLYKTTPDSVKVVPEYISTVNDYLSNLNSIRLTDIKLLAEINKKHLLETELILKQFVNLIVEEINKLKKHDDKTIEIISQIDDLLNKISSLKNIAGTIDKLFVQKLKECSRYLLAYKRSLLSKDDGSWLELKELRIPFDDDMIEYAQTMINKNIFNVYSFLKLDIDDMMKKAIFAKSQYPLSYTLRNFEIDTKQGVYRTSIKHNDFKKSIEEAGLVLQESLLQDHKEKMPNVFNKGFYSALRETILREHDITLAILEYVVDLRDLSIRLIEQLDLMFDLKLKPSKELFTIPQILLQKVVLIIEQMLSRQSETNIDTYLLNLYKTSDDELKNDAFLLYFILYAHDGYKLRHNISHGNIIDNNYKREMILGLVAFVAMRNTITGAHKNE